MLPIENEKGQQIRYPGRPDSEAGTVRPMRTPNPLFHGWGPKLFAAALALSGVVATSKAALADTQIALISSCATADHGASVLSSPILETPEGVGASGEAIVRVNLSAAGQVKAMAIAQSSGSFDLDFAAMRQVQRSHYAPASIGCNAAEDTALYDVTFNNQ